MTQENRLPTDEELLDIRRRKTRERKQYDDFLESPPPRTRTTYKSPLVDVGQDIWGAIPESVRSGIETMPFSRNFMIDTPERRAIERGFQLAGLPVTTGVSAGIQSTLGHDLPPIVRDQILDWLPDVRKTPESLRAFAEYAGQGDFDAAIPAYQDPMDAGWGAWGLGELGAEIAATGVPYKAGGRIISQAPRYAKMLEQFVPQRFRGTGKGTADRAGMFGAPEIEKRLIWGGKQMRVPWELEEAVGRWMTSKAVGVLRGASDAVREIVDKLRGIDGAVPVQEAMDKTMLALPAGQEMKALPAGRSQTDALRVMLNMGPDDRLVTIVSPDDPRGTVYIIKNNAVTRRALVESGMEGAWDDVQIIDGVLSEDEGMERFWKGEIFETRPLHLQERAANILRRHEADLKTLTDNYAKKKRPSTAKAKRDMKEFTQKASRLNRLIKNARIRLRAAEATPEDPTRQLDIPFVPEEEFAGARPLTPEERASSAIQGVMQREGEQIYLPPERVGTWTGGARPLTAAEKRGTLSGGMDMADELLGQPQQAVGGTRIDEPDIPDPLDIVEEAEQALVKVTEDVGTKSAKQVELEEQADVVLGVGDLFTRLEKPGGKIESATEKIVDFFVRGKRAMKSQAFAPYDPSIEGIIAAAGRNSAAFVRRMQSQGNVFVSKVKDNIGRAFNIDNQGLFLDANLQNRVEGIVSPSLQDVAARLDTYGPYLNETQAVFMRMLRAELEDGILITDGTTKLYRPGFNQELRNNVPNWKPERIRPDIEPGGFYIPRGTVTSKRKIITRASESIEDHFGDSITVRKIGPEHPSKVASMYHGIMMGHEYEAIDITLRKYISDVAKKLKEINIVARAKEATKADLKKIDSSLEDVVRDLELNSDDVQGGERMLLALQREMRREKGLIPESLRGKHVGLVLNSLYRGVKTTYDLGHLTIQGTLGLVRRPRAFSEALKTSLRAFAKGEGITDELIANFNSAYVAGHRALPADVHAALGVRIGGAATEMEIPLVSKWRKGLAGWGPGITMRGRRITLGDALGYAVRGGELSNISFGSFGDRLRLDWADAMWREELAKGRTLQEIYDSGDWRVISDTANMLTGWSDEAFAGSLGEAIGFAPRFLQARLDSAGQAILGTARMPLDVSSSLARGSVVEGTVTRVTDAADRVTGGMSRQTIKSRESANALTRFLGLAALTVEIVNLALGHDTDRRPMVNGRPNPNFYVIRALDRDIQIMGTWMGLYRALALVASGRPQDAVNSLGGGMTRLVFDTVTGFRFGGKEFPLRQGEIPTSPREVWDQLGEIRSYVQDMYSPISAAAAGVEGYDFVQSVRRGDVKGAVAAGVSAIGEVAGGRITRLSFDDRIRERASEVFPNIPYEELTLNDIDLLEHMDTEEVGPDEYLYESGKLRKQKDDTNNKFIKNVNSKSEELLQSPSGKWSVKTMKSIFNNESNARVTSLRGTWDRDKQEHTGGLYDHIEDKEPEKGTKSHILWQYYNTYKQAADTNGNIDYDDLEILQQELWASLDADDFAWLMGSLHTMDKNLTPELQSMRSAGRYVGRVEVEIGTDAKPTKYWDIEKHSDVIQALINKGHAEWRILNYLEESFIEREDLVRDSRHPDRYKAIENDLFALKNRGEVIHNLRMEFISKVEEPWLYAMVIWHYEIPGGDEAFKMVRDMVSSNYSDATKWTTYDYDDLARVAIRQSALRNQQ